MKSFDPDFDLRAYFQVRYGDVIDMRASKLIPYLSMHDSCRIDYSDTDGMLWPNTSAPLEPVMEEQSVDVLAPWYGPSFYTNTPEYFIISPEAGLEACSTSTTESSTDSPRPRKRQAANLEDGDHGGKKCKSVPSRKTVRFESRAGLNEHPAIVQWNKSLIFCLRPCSLPAVQDLRYTYVKLPAPDVELCAIAICTKMGIPYTKGMTISWSDGKTSIHRPFDHAFLWTVADKQDFLIDILDTGIGGSIELLLEM